MIKQRLSSIVLGVTLAACGGSVAIGGPKDSASQTPSVDDPLGTIPQGTLTRASKLDLLLMIDNSPSMSDKQQLLKKSLPDLLTRLVRPRCLGPSGNVLGESASGVCAAGRPEFAPVRDMHIGILSSSLGGRGSDACPTSSPELAHNDDHGWLLQRGGDDSHLVADAAAGFLSFGPGGITDPAVLRTDLTDLVAGVHDDGCGFEHQLESWYRFLVQPDPYAAIVRDPRTNRTDLDGVDAKVLKQRHDFLRPDSLVAVLMLTDEEDGSLDPNMIRGQGFAFMETQFPSSTVFRPDGKSTTAPRGSSACEASPAAAECNSCAFGQTCDPSDGACQQLRSDPNCQVNGGYYGGAEDSLAVRFHHMRKRYGLDPQFPVRRYVNGLSSAKVPSRKGEHEPLPALDVAHPQPLGPLPKKDEYLGKSDCNNPLFSQNLPTEPGEELCNLQPGPRSRDLVVFGVITGVPNQLLTAPALGEVEWTRILGRDPVRFDESGIDPHMIQSASPRAGLPGPSAALDADPIHGREVDTHGDDLQFACTFPLETPMECAGSIHPCDCQQGSTSSLCDPTPGSARQLRGKAFPGIRQLEVARVLGSRSIVSSLCPLHAVEKAPGDPLFGYRSAMAKLGDRMAQSLVLE